MSSKDMSENQYAAWFKEAQADLKAGDALLEKKIYNLAIFHFIQAAEKSVKALLYLNNMRPWGHSIATLLEDYEDLGKRVSELIKDAAIDLDPHYILSRYPDISDDTAPSERYDEAGAKKIEKNAREIIRFVERERTAFSLSKQREEDK